MATSKLFSLLPLLSMAVVLTLHTAMAADPLFHFCSNSGNFTPNSNYQNNLNQLLGDLYLKTPINGFGSGSAGKYSDQTYGLSLCRGDVSAADCKSCVADAGSTLRDRCPYNKGGIIWYDNCLVKYSDEDFLGKIDNGNKFYMWNVQEVSNPEEFNRKTKELLSELAGKAYAVKSLYATGETELGAGGSSTTSEKLYGLVQCTRDLSGEDCKKCLDGAIGELPNCCDAKEGGRVVGGSCNFRYEIYPFVNDA
nr:cysteine-rich repeat secretory protein 38-like [Ipomoea trifida]